MLSLIRIEKELIKNRKIDSIHFWTYLPTFQRESSLKHNAIMRIKSLLCAIRFITCGRDRNQIWFFANFLTPSLEFQTISKSNTYQSILSSLESFHFRINWSTRIFGTTFFRKNNDAFFNLFSLREENIAM